MTTNGLDAASTFITFRSFAKLWLFAILGLRSQPAPAFEADESSRR